LRVATSARSIRRVAENWYAEPILLLALAASVGMVGGLGAIVFRLMIVWAGLGIHALLGHTVRLPLPSELLGPVVGLLLVGVISTYFA
jgi:tetrahydromethanopterin S-methyltransferase subunit E